MPSFLFIFSLAYFLILIICQNTCLSAIQQRISQLTQSYKELTYTVNKLEYSLLKSQHFTEQQCPFNLLSSISIHEGESLSYPVIVQFCNAYYSIKGHLITNLSNFDVKEKNNSKIKYFVCSMRNQFTYFAQILENEKQENSTVYLSKLQLSNKKIIVEKNTIFEIPKKYGSIVSFSNSFSLSSKMFAFATHSSNLLFYKSDGKLQNILRLSENDQIYYNVEIVKLNNNLAIYTKQLNEYSFLYTIGTNGKNSTLKKFYLPSLSIHSPLQLKYNDNNWNQFYLKIGARLYVYQHKSTLTTIGKEGAYEILPIKWFRLLNDHDKFHIAGSMVIIESHFNKTNGQKFRYFYNLTDGKYQQFLIPCLPCEKQTSISIASQALGSHVMCQFCPFSSFQCYSLFSLLDTSFSSSSSSTMDYSKFRVPLVLISIGVVIFISITRGKKGENKTIKEEKQEEQFMKELEGKDKRLYEQLQRGRKGKSEAVKDYAHQLKKTHGKDVYKQRQQLMKYSKKQE